MNAFAAHCEKQAATCANLGSPFTAQLCRLLGARLTPGHAVADRLLAWESLAPDAVALRIVGGLHALAMRHPGSALAKAFPPHKADDDRLWQAVGPALLNHEAFLLEWLHSAPQTNEIRRCCGLIPAFHWLAARFGLPMQLSEIGASAGLNMNWDHYALNIAGQVWGPKASPVQLAPEWRGEKPPLAAPAIAGKAGCDLHPIDPQNLADRARLHAYIWADQTARHTATRAALDMAKTPPEKADALAFLSRRLATPTPGTLQVIYHSIVWQYLPAPVQAACTARLEAAGKAATVKAPLAWVSVEADNTEGSAGMQCRLWPGGATYTLGRIDFHGRWVEWQPLKTAN